VPLRRAPFVGAPVTVVFLGRRVPGSVEEIHDGGRRLVVITDEGETIAFTLGRASGRFVEENRASGGARLIFEEP
jgi:hypothetical protein